MSIIKVLQGHAKHVMKILGKGHREAVYHRALITSLNRQHIPHRSEVPCPIMFMGECVGMGRADVVIDDVVVEIKANKLPPEETSPQLQKYMESLRKAERREFRGVVINFNQKMDTVDILEEKCARDVPVINVQPLKISAVFKRSLQKTVDESKKPALFRHRRLHY